jgi:xanthine dehydrogenase accessory factor
VGSIAYSVPSEGSGRATVDVLDQVVRWRSEGAEVALATVVSTWGSSPRPAGSQLAVNAAGVFEGSVSGGCVEGAVIDAALRAIASGTHELLDFGISDEMAWEVGLACGGEMQVLVERLAPSSGEDTSDVAWLDELMEDRAAKRPAVLIADLSSGRRSLLHPPPHPRSAAATSADDPVEVAAREVLRNDRSRVLEHADLRVFLQPFNPPLRLVIVGAVHIAQPLARMATETGYEVVVLDPRGAFADASRFPDVALSRAWPDEGLAALGLDARCAVVTLTHDPKLDDAALSVALRSSAFYVGSLGSRRTQARRLERLRALGVDEESLTRIHGPVGLDIGARSPAEIALSILAEITTCLRASAAP